MGSLCSRSLILVLIPLKVLKNKEGNKNYIAIEMQEALFPKEIVIISVKIVTILVGLERSNAFYFSIPCVVSTLSEFSNLGTK